MRHADLALRDRTAEVAQASRWARRLAEARPASRSCSRADRPRHRSHATSRPTAPAPSTPTPAASKDASRPMSFPRTHRAASRRHASPVAPRGRSTPPQSARGCPPRRCGSPVASSIARRPAELSATPGAKACRSSGSTSFPTRTGPATSRLRPPNTHPTVKPLALMRWLVRLVTPGAGRLLDPFCGSGSTDCAAVLEGRRFLGIELDAGYAEIARARIAHWEGPSAAERGGA